MEERGEDRRHLWRAIQEAGVAPGDVKVPSIDKAPVDEALLFVGLTPAPLVSYPLEDLLGVAEQPNLPGSIDEHPNWRRRLALPVEEMFANAAFSGRLLAVDSARKRSGHQDNSYAPKHETTMTVPRSA
jgi:4-alpha-glucanotransferase